MKVTLFGDPEHEPNQDAIVQLANDIYSNDLIPALLTNIVRLEFEVNQTFLSDPPSFSSLSNCPHCFIVTLPFHPTNPVRPLFDGCIYLFIVIHRYLLIIAAGKERFCIHIQSSFEKTSWFPISYCRIHMPQCRHS